MSPGADWGGVKTPPKRTPYRPWDTGATGCPGGGIPRGETGVGLETHPSAPLTAPGAPEPLAAPVGVSPGGNWGGVRNPPQPTPYRPWGTGASAAPVGVAPRGDKDNCGVEVFLVRQSIPNVDETSLPLAH